MSSDRASLRSSNFLRYSQLQIPAKSPPDEASRTEGTDQARSKHITDGERCELVSQGSKSLTLASLRRMLAMVASRIGGGGKRSRMILLLVGATIAALCIKLTYFSTEDLSDVFYPPPDSEGAHADLWLDSASHTSRNSQWITPGPLPDLTPDSTIFFLETSGRRELSPRVWCAVESAARAHPHHTILLLVSTPRLSRAAPASAILSLNNTRLARLRFNQIVSGTTLEPWYHSRVILKSWWQASHMSDALRFALLERYGGIYLDTDVIVRRSMAEMDDGAGLESEHSVAAGVLKFSQRSPIPRLLSRWFVDHYEPHDWGMNGPGVVTSVLLKRCGFGELPLPPSHCGDFTIFGSRRFYGVPWPEWRLLIVPAQRDTVLERVDASYVVHTWGLHITGHAAPPGSAMYQLAEQHCPLALAAAGGSF